MRLSMLAVVLFAVLPVAAQEDKVSVKLLDRQSVDQAAQEAEPEPEPIEVEVVEEPAKEEEPGIASRLTASAWCPILERRREPASEEPAGGEGSKEGQQTEEQQEGVQCDFGVGMALLGRDFRQGRLSLVGVLGAQSLGAGIGWTFAHQGSHPLSVALGVVMPYTSEGVFADEAALAVGATISVFGRR